MDNNLINMLNEELNTEDQQIFLQNFKCYLNNDQEHDFVIDLEFTFKWIGFTRKDNIKRLLEKHFIINIDYKILLPKEEKSNSTINHEGRPKETIMMTPNTFKELCVLASTEKGKQVRRYYIKMEAITYRYLKLQNEIQAKESQTKIEYLQSEMLKLQKPIRKKFELGETVYIYKHLKNENIFKVGSSKNMNTRDDNYYCHNISGEVVYTKRCNNEKILEDIVHYILRNHTVDSHRKDWFNVKYEIIRDIIDATSIFLEQSSNNCLHIESLKLSENINNIFNNIPIIEIPIIDNKEELTEDRNKNVQYQEIKEIIIEPINVPNKELFHNSTNFDKFLSECFVIDENSATSSIDIIARYRLWSRSKNDFRELLINHIKNQGFKEILVYDQASKCNLTSYQGIKIILLDPFTLTDTSSEVEKFIFEECIPCITGRISSKSLFETYLSWKTKLNPEYIKITNNEKKVINTYFNKHFFGSTVYTGERIRFGFYGICLKNQDSELVGKKQKPQNRKIIQQIDQNNVVVHEYISITQAAFENNVSISKMSVVISNNQQYKGFNFRIKN